MIENCPMRHENGNCIPAGGFCTANKNICEALLNAYKMGKTQLPQEGTTSDLISRQAVLDAVGKYASVWMEYTDAMSKDEIAQIALNNAKSTMIRILKELPTVQHERKKGEWIMNGNGTYSCSVCQSWIPEEQHHYARYCLYCGADMKGVSNERTDLQTGGD